MAATQLIIAGVDFSPFSESALKQAGRIAQSAHAKLQVVHVIESFVLADLETALKAARGNVRDEVLAGFREKLKALVAQMVPGSVSVESEVRVGNPVMEVLKVVRDRKADLLVIGSNGASDPSQGPGTLATKCVRKAVCNVLLVRGTHSTPFQRIVACVDFSDTSKRAMEEAIRAAAQDGSRLDVLHVFAPPWQVLHYRAPTPQACPEFEQEFRQGLDAYMAQFLKPFEGEIQRLGAQQKIVESQRPAAGIIDYLRESRADLAVVGTRGRSGIVTMLLGTIAERVVSQSPCSVLAVKPAGFEYPLG
ncbi:MAG TPA: universal stress protein [Planctomycetota bacterium]|nr:universal stress protein [Planctomycetota bacterium]